MSVAAAPSTSNRAGSPDRRRARRVEALISGEHLDGPDLGYDLDMLHLGTVALGSEAGAAIEQIADSLGRQPLVIRARDGATWGWLGSSAPFDRGDLEEALLRRRPAALVLGVGEPAHGAGGWRLTHLQARAALSVARRSGERMVRYGDVVLLASIIRDDLLAASLHQMYLKPLEGERDGGEALRQTLRGYFSAGRNASRAAAALGITRQAVSRRLRAAEELLGRSIEEHGMELEVALRFEELEATFPRAA